MCQLATICRISQRQVGNTCTGPAAPRAHLQQEQNVRIAFIMNTTNHENAVARDIISKIHQKTALL